MRTLGVLALVAGLAASGCGIPDAAEQDGSNIILLVTEVVATPGGEGTESAFLLSDVVRVSEPAGVFNDNALITVESTPKNPNTNLTLSAYDTTNLQRYTVRYFRTDGRNVEGEDVPFAFQGPLAGTVVAGDDTEIALILVRHQAKLEPPLNRLRESGGATILSCFAEVVIYGNTLTGDVVSARATIGITFADFGD